MTRINNLAIKLCIISYLAVGIIPTSNAQISIYPMDMPTSGQEIYMATASLFPIYNWPETGTGMMWDYSALQESSGELIHYQSVNQTPFVYQFLFNNPFDPNYNADFALPSPPLDIAGFISTTDNYSYYQTTNEHFAAVGQGSTINDFPMPSKYAPMDVIYEFPLNFGGNFEGYSELIFEIPNQLTYKFKQNRITEVDGWGTLSLPSGTYECLRVKSTLQITDSLVIPDLFVNFELPRLEEVHYQWLASMGGPPLLEVIQIAGVTSKITFQSTATSIQEEVVLPNSMYPNPCREKLFFKGLDNTVITFFDLNGLIVKKETTNQHFTLVNDLPAGIYGVKLNQNGKVSFQNILVVD